MSRNTRRPENRACRDSQAMISESANLINGSGEAIAQHRDQIARSNELLEKSRRQIANYRDGSR